MRMIRDCSAAREANREQRTEGDRHLTENVAGLPLPDHAVDPVYELDGLDTTIKEREQRPLVALISGVLDPERG